MNYLKKQKYNINKQEKTPVVLYFLGLFVALVSVLFIDDNILKNFLFTISMIITGYHVIIKQGLSEIIINTKANGKFTPNSEMLMGLAAFGAALIGNFWEGVLLLLIF